MRVDLTAFIFRIDLSTTLEASICTEKEKVLTVHILEFQIHARD